MSTFDKDEFDYRIRRVRNAMLQHNVDALVVSHPPELRYLTGFAPPLAVSSARPWFAVVGLDGPTQIAVAALCEREASNSVSQPTVTTWKSPQPDEGLDVLLQLLANTGVGNIALALGYHTRLGVPAGWLDVVRQTFPTRVLRDSGELLWPVRWVKSEKEVHNIRAAAAAAQAGFDAIQTVLKPGITEIEIARIAKVAALNNGADDVGYIAIGSGPNGYESLVDRPSNRALNAGDILGVDIGVSVDGYWCDYNRNFSIGPVDPFIANALAALADCARVGCETAKPGQLMSDIWNDMAAVLDEAGFETPRRGRMGHGVGTEFTESPSIAPEDHTQIVPGMVLSIEPLVDLPNGKLLTYEDMIHVTPSDSPNELLTIPMVCWHT